MTRASGPPPASLGPTPGSAGPTPEGEGFDLRLALRKLENYSRAAGMPSHLIDARGGLLGACDASGAAVEGTAAGLCPACPSLGMPEREEERRAQLFAAYQAERFGGSYIQLCPHSLLFWAAPIVVDGIMRAAFIGGPAMVVEASEVFGELSAAGKVPPGSETSVRAALELAPRVAPQRASSLAELLSDAAAAVVLPSPLVRGRERDENESRISEYIQFLKEEGSPPSAPYPIEKERELLRSISRGDEADSQRLLNEILGFIFFSTGRDAPVVKARVLELVVLLSRAALEGGADTEQVFGLNFAYLTQLNRMRSVDDIAAWLSRIIVRFTDLVFTLKDVKHADTMQKALKYVFAHYSEEITLEDVAGAVFLSPAYFSKLFSEEMGCRFTAYLNKVRIERSKLLLKGSAIPLVDIAGLVGYEDQSYFTTVFKRITGLSPGRFRVSGGRLAGDSREIHDEEPPRKKSQKKTRF